MSERERLIELLKSDSCESPMLCDPKFGENMFFTREEAEKALEEREQK